MHGWPESWFSWRHQLTFFGQQGYRVFAPDMRGYGRTDSPPRSSDFTVYHHASDMIALLQHYGLTKCILIGHDWGAILCWQLAHLFPEYFVACANLSVPYRLRTPSTPNPLHTLIKTFGEYNDPQQYFFYIVYHNEMNNASSYDHGPAEAEYDANPHELIYNMWSDDRVKTDDSTISNKVGVLRRDGGMLANLRSKKGRPAEYPAWCSEADMDYVVEQFKVSGFRGGVNYYRNFGTNHQLTPQLINRKLHCPAFFLTGEDDLVRKMRFAVVSSDPFASGSSQTKSSQSDNDDFQKRGLETVCSDLRSFTILKRDKNLTAGHWIQQERPKEVNNALLSFFRDVEDVFHSAVGGPLMRGGTNSKM
jgi:pimeloyl-ACP methyl ester carboxylesterase